MNYEGYSDIEIYELLEKANLAEMIAEQPEWKLLRTASERIIERAIEQFAKHTDPENLVEIIKLQVTIKKYKYGLFEEVEFLRQDAELAFEEAKARDIIQKSAV